MESKANKHKPTASSDGTRPPNKQHHDPSPAELLSSAKLIAGAAQMATRKEIDKIDKGKVSSAAADLLHAASHYGHLEEQKFGQYVGKAESYLRQYESKSNSSSADAPSATSAAASGQSKPKPKPAPEKYHGDEKDESSGEGGIGDYMKMAQGFMGHGGGPAKHGGESGSGGGAGDYVKMAQEFMGHSGGSGSGGHHGAEGGSEGGIGDYVKMAQGFMGKTGGGGENHGGGGGSEVGIGDYLKLAQGFVKKH